MIPFLNSTLVEALNAGCDTVQIKHEGGFGQMFPKTGMVKTFPSTGCNIRTDLTAAQPHVSCTLIGSYSPLAKKFFVYDCWLVEEPPGEVIDLRNEPYRTRYVTARLQLSLMQRVPQVQLVQNHPISHAERLWKSLNEVPSAKGLVYRRSKDPAMVQLRYTRWYAEAPRELL